MSYINTSPIVVRVGQADGQSVEYQVFPDDSAIQALKAKGSDFEISRSTISLDAGAFAALKAVAPSNRDCVLVAGTGTQSLYDLGTAV